METKMKIEYRKLTDKESDPWLLLTNIDELIWNGVYALRVSDDDGSLGLPFRFGNSDTVTIVVKDHAHEGKLQNGRTVVQTITHVERANGSVFTYTRSRHYADGQHAWNYWTLTDNDGNSLVEGSLLQQINDNTKAISDEAKRACSAETELSKRIKGLEDNSMTSIPKATTDSLGGVIIGDGLSVDDNGNVAVAMNSINENKLSPELKNKLNNAAYNAAFIEELTLNDGIVLNYGALRENSEPYIGTRYVAHTGKILANGETIFPNEGYKISAYKIFSGEEEVLFSKVQDVTELFLEESGYYYQLEFTKDDAANFNDKDLENAIKSFIRKPYVWSDGKHIDDFITPGTYIIKGKRLYDYDGLPIYNTGAIDARLTVLASDNCVTQVLTMLNVSGGDSNIYVRTKQGNDWGTWGKLQTNVEVEAIGLGQSRTFDDLIDSGIYSGVNVYATGTDGSGYPITSYETFVLVVINAYLTGGGVSQLKYSLLLDGTTGVTTRTKHNGVWSEWGELGVIKTEEIQNNSVTADKLSTDVREKLDNPLRPLFISAGALYNSTNVDVLRTAPWGEKVIHKAGHYYLNGLGDITEEQMMEIYNAPHRMFAPHAYSFQKARTVFCKGNGTFGALKSYECYYWFYSSNVEVVAENNYSLFLNGENTFVSAFNGCTRLKHINCIIYCQNCKLTNTFKDCYEMVNVLLERISDALSFAQSPYISKDSIKYAIDKAQPVLAITITLHPDAYARLADDAEIVVALEAQPLISLVSA